MKNTEEQLRIEFAQLQADMDWQRTKLRYENALFRAFLLRTEPKAQAAKA